MNKLFCFVLAIFFILSQNIYAQDDKISYEQASNMVLENTDDLKKLEESMIYLDEQKRKTQSDLNNTSGSLGDTVKALASTYKQIMDLMNSLMVYENNISNYDMQKKIYRDTAELALRNHLYNLKTYYLDLDLYKKELEVAKSNLHVSEIKHERGLISDLDFVDAQDKVNKKNNDINDLNTKLKNEKQVLNKLLGLDINSESDFDLEVPKETFDTDIDTHILNELNNSPTLAMKRKKVDEAQYAVDSYFSLTGDPSTKVDNDLNQIRREYEEMKKNLQENIRSSYNNLQNLRDNQKILEQNILNANKNYESDLVKYKAGVISLNSLNENKLNIDRAKVNSEKNQIAISKLIFTLNRSYLLSAK